MKVYADLRWSWQNGAAGIENVKLELLRRKPKHLNVVELPIRGRIGNPMGPLSIARGLARSGARNGVFWSPGFMPPISSRIPVVVTVHDLIHLTHYTRLHRAYYDVVLRRLYRRCRAVVCVSEFTRREFIAWSNLPEDRVVTIHNGISEHFFARAAGAHRGYPYILYPGNRRPHKNLHRLLTAYARSSLPARDIRLALTGPPDKSLQQMAADLGVAHRVEFIGRVEDSDLVGLYQGSRAVVLVSLAEGFGLPIVEAMAAGVPVVTSSLSAMPEIAGGAAILVDPYSTDAIQHGLEQAVFDGAVRETKIRLGALRAREFNWDTSAHKLWSLIESL